MAKVTQARRVVRRALMGLVTILGFMAAVGPAHALARTECDEARVRAHLARRPPAWASLVPVRRVRGVRGTGARVRMGQPEFGEPVVGALVRAGCAAVAVSYRFDLQLEAPRGQQVFHAPRTVWGRAVLELNGDRLRVVAHSQDAPATHGGPDRLLMARNIDSTPTAELLELAEGAHRAEVRAFSVRRGALVRSADRVPVPEVEVRFSQLRADGPIPESALLATLVSRVTPFERCVASAAFLRDEPPVSRTLELVLGPHGELQRVRPGTGQRSIEFMSHCVQSLSDQWPPLTVPPGSGEVTRVRMPVVFRGRGTVS